MPKCRVCGSHLTRYQKEVCPICGERNPFAESDHYTADLTQVVQSVKKEELPSTYNPYSKRLFTILAATCGFFGIHLFYIKRNIHAAIWLTACVILSVGSGLLSFFLMDKNWLGFLIGFGSIYLVNIIFGIVTIFSRDIKDGNGEFLK